MSQQGNYDGTSLAPEQAARELTRRAALNLVIVDQADEIARRQAAQHQLVDLVADLAEEVETWKRFAAAQYCERLKLETRVNGLVEKWQQSRAEVMELAAKFRAVQDRAA
jgi:hypothetical protein